MQAAVIYGVCVVHPILRALGLHGVKVLSQGRQQGPGIFIAVGLRPGCGIIHRGRLPHVRQRAVCVYLHPGHFYPLHALHGKHPIGLGLIGQRDPTERQGAGHRREQIAHGFLLPFFQPQNKAEQTPAQEGPQDIQKPVVNIRTAPPQHKLEQLHCQRQHRRRPQHPGHLLESRLQQRQQHPQRQKQRQVQHDIQPRRPVPCVPGLLPGQKELEIHFPAPPNPPAAQQGHADHSHQPQPKQPPHKIRPARQRRFSSPRPHTGQTNAHRNTDHHRHQKQQKHQRGGVLVPNISQCVHQVPHFSSPIIIECIMCCISSVVKKPKMQYSDVLPCQTATLLSRFFIK